MKDSHTASFAVFCTQRTGSTYLVELLDSHPTVRCHLEAFGPRNTKEWSYRSFISYDRKRPRSLIRRRLRVSEYLAALAADAPEAVVGFKLMYSHVRHALELVPVALRARLKIVHLVRRDLLRTHVSGLIAARDGVWSSRDHVREFTKINVPLDGLADAISRRRRQIERARMLIRALPFVEIAYEDLSESPSETLRPVFSLLGADSGHEPSATTHRQSPPDITEVVANLDSVLEVLQENNVSWVLR